MIIDMFLFNGEEQMLNFRLHEYYDHVDQFVIVEAPVTTLNVSKELTWPKMKHKFEQFSDKIKYVVTPPMYEPDKVLTQEECIVWQRHQRNIIREQLDLADDDIIFHGDLDEIWDVRRLGDIVKLLESHDLVKFTQTPWYVWDLNHVLVDYTGMNVGKDLLANTQLWFLGFFTTGKIYKSWRATRLRAAIESIRINTPINPTTISDAAWHMTWFGGDEAIKKKALTGMGSDIYHYQKRNQNKDMAKQVMDRYKKKRPPHVFREFDGSLMTLEVEIVPDRLPINYKLLL